MTPVLSSPLTKKLLIRFVLENIDYRKKCSSLQDIIALSKINDVWRQALNVFFDTPFKSRPLKAYSKN